MELTSDAPELPAENRNADEATTLLDMLGFYRVVLVRKSWGLSPEQLQASPLPSTLSLARLLSHMAFVEDHWFHHCLGGHPVTQPWVDLDFETDADAEMALGEQLPYSALLELLATSIDRSNRVVAEADGLDTTGRGELGDGVSLRWILVHMIEEYARHVGHADLIREAIDSQTDD